MARRIGWKQQYLARRLTPNRPVPFSLGDIEAIAEVLEVDPEVLTADRMAVAA